MRKDIRAPVGTRAGVRGRGTRPTSTVSRPYWIPARWLGSGAPWRGWSPVVCVSHLWRLKCDKISIQVHCFLEMKEMIVDQCHFIGFLRAIHDSIRNS